MNLVTYVDGLSLSSDISYVSARNTLSVESPSLPALDSKEQAFFSEKTIMSFAFGVPEESRKDILNSTLFAQMAANNKVPDSSNVIDWYHAFIDVLSGIGWVIESRDVQSFVSKSNLFEVDAVIIDILTAAFGAGYITVIKKTLEAIKKLSSADRKIKAFERCTYKVSKGGFQIALVAEKDGVVSLKIGTFILNSNHEITTILFFKSDRQQTQLDYVANQATLNGDVYGHIRDLIKAKLGTYVRTNIAQINLS